ncbi:hypothetical protein RQP46_002631 [Phenoliferia psychrophenolica]
MSLDDTKPSVKLDGGADVEQVDTKHALNFADENKGVDAAELADAAEHLTLEEAKRIIHDATDDFDMPVNTFRSWFIGLIFTMIGTGVNVFFAARQPGITLNVFCAQVLSYPCGKALEYLLPTKSWTAFGKQWSFNPGKFNIYGEVSCENEETIPSHSTDIIFVQRLPQFFNQNAVGGNPGYQFLLTLSTQLIGFGMAGFSRRFLVYATIVLNRSFHQDTNPTVHGWSISRLRFFTYVFLGYGVYFILPDAIAGFLTTFNWMTWISPNNVKLAIFTGSISGLGINPITSFDWSYISFNSSPLVTPLFSTLNIWAGAAIIGLTMIPALYFTNTWYTAYLPINSNHLFANTGKAYNISKILTPEFTLDEEKFALYGYPYQSAGNAVLFAAFFAVYTATLMHIILYFRPEVINGFRAVFQRKSARDAYNDVHNRLMRRYDEVPEVIGGYTLPGKPLAVMIFKTQLIASILASFVGLGVANWQIVNLDGICTAGQVSHFSCPGYNTFFNSAVQWGAIGPARLYSAGKIYYPLVYGFLVGAIAPIPVYILTRKYPNSYWKYVSMPAFIYGALNWAPYNLSYLTPGVPIALYFQGYLRRNKLAWWTKYNYILSSALTSSISLFGVLWFFALLYKNFEPVWWGNTVSTAGCDGRQCPLLPMPAKGCFGPAPACPE